MSSPRERPDDWLLAKDIEKRYGISQRTVRRAEKKGELRSYRPFGRRIVLFRRSDVERWLDSKPPRA